MAGLKIKLDQIEGFYQLHILTELKLDQHKVLLAGLTKLLKEGKNRLFLVFYANIELAPEIMESLKKLNSLARELAGEITLISTNTKFIEDVQKQIENQQLYVFPSASEAIQFIRKKEPKSAEAELISKLKAELAEKSGGEIGKLKKENEDLITENKLLLSRIDRMIDDRQSGFEPEALLEKNQILEKKLTQLLTEKEAKDAKESTSNPHS